MIQPTRQSTRGHGEYVNQAEGPTIRSSTYARCELWLPEVKAVENL